MGPNGSWPSITGTLYGYGAMPWPQICEMLQGFEGAWGDTDGMHLGEPLPAQAPAYTHVWAWRSGLYARIRLDLPSDRHILGLLTVNEKPPNGQQPAIPPEAVTATVYPVRGWGNHDRVKAVAEPLRRPALERLVTRQAAALTFVRPTGADS